MRCDTYDEVSNGLKMGLFGLALGGIAYFVTQLLPKARRSRKSADVAVPERKAPAGRWRLEDF